MLIQDRIETIILQTENQELINDPEDKNKKTNDANLLVISTKEVNVSIDDLILDSNRRKFESEIGRDIVHERRMRKELMENSSSTGKNYAVEK